MRFIIFAAALLCVSEIYAQSQPSTYVDSEGILRWTASKKELNEFGVNYTTPFAHAYRAHNFVKVNHEQAIDEDVYHLTRLGLKAYRIHVWDVEISDSVGNLLDNEHLRLLDYTLKKMKDRGFKIVLTPIAYWGNGYPDRDERTGAFSYIYGKDPSLTNPKAILAQEKYLYQFMNHVNRYTGLAYKDDPDVVAVEISNEPHHSGAAEATTAFINRMVTAIRSTGCQIPLFYNMAFSTQLLNAYLDANIQGGTIQWYSTGLVEGHNKFGNFLPAMDKWPKDHITIPIRNKKKSLLVYEFDAADNGYTYTYPVMAREFRKAGFQFAAQFSYDPLNIAYANTEYQTHFMNLAYAPQKALSLKIAGEAFRRIPLGKTYGSYPADTLFDAVRVSYTENLAELLTPEKFMYANSTSTVPASTQKLTELAGFGNSPLVNYPGLGAYFLDKLQDGVWRLEVMPDAIWVSDPFERTNLRKEVSVVEWNKWPMKIRMPNLGADYAIIGLNDGNTMNAKASSGTVSVGPGAYLLVRKGVKSPFTATSKWKDITLKEFVAPKATVNNYVLHQPTEEITAGGNLQVEAKIVSKNKPRLVELFIPSSGQAIRLPLIESAPYTYSAKVPAALVAGKGILNYYILVTLDGKTLTYPAGTEGEPPTADIAKMYKTLVAEPSEPIYLFNAFTDGRMVIKPNRNTRLSYEQSPEAGRSGIWMDRANLSHMTFFFKNKVSGRTADLDKFSKITLSGHSTVKPVQLQVSIIMADGSEFGKVLSINTGRDTYSIDLKTLEKVSRNQPELNRDIEVTQSAFSNSIKTAFDIRKAESIKCTWVEKEGTEKIAVESLRLD